MPDPNYLCFVDTETTSLRDDRRIWEIALINRPNGNRWPSSRMLMQIEDVDLSDADPHALQIGGFYQRHGDYTTNGVRVDTELLPEADAAVYVERYTRGAVLVGINPPFDADGLAAMLRRNRLVPSWDYHMIDVRQLAFGWLMREPKLRHIDPKISTDALAELTGFAPPDEAVRHTAMGDAQFALDWFDHLTDGRYLP